MFSTLMTIVRGETLRTQERLENRNASVILEQKIREAETSHERAKRTLATLILKERNEESQINALTARQEDLEERIKKALKAGLEELAGEAAQHLARMETEQAARQIARERTQLSIQRLRHMIDTGQARLIDLKQGLITVKSITAERESHSAINGDLGAMASLTEAEAVLARFLDQPDPLEETAILDDLNADLNGDDIITRLADAGCGAAPATRAEDVLSRIRDRMSKED